MDMSTASIATAVWQASKLMAWISSSTPRYSAMYLARVTSKPTYWSCPSLEESTNSIGAKSGDSATVSTPASLIASSSFFSPAAKAVQPSARSITSASAMQMIFFIFIPSHSSDLIKHPLDDCEFSTRRGSCQGFFANLFVLNKINSPNIHLFGDYSGNK